MTDQEINEAIALHLGWTKETKEIDYQDGYQWTEIVTHWRTPGGTRFSYCEDYCSDLNAMHEAEEAILKNEDLFQGYDAGLHHEVYPAWNASARQRAEAFVKTIGKWRDA